MKRQHLTLNDINIGDYVQEWMEIPGKWGPPMYIDGIFANGDIYLDLNGNEADPFDANVSNIFDIPIDFGILPHFGFFEAEHHLYQIEYEGLLLMVNVYKHFETFIVKAMLVNNDTQKIVLSTGSLNSVRTLQHWFYENTGVALKLDFN